MTPDYYEGCNQQFAPIDQQSCWGCKDGDCNTSKRGVRMYSREEIERIKDGLICDEVCANHHGLAYIHQLESTISQVSKALCNKENATLDELLQAVSQVKSRVAQLDDPLKTFSEIKRRGYE